MPHLGDSVTPAYVLLLSPLILIKKTTEDATANMLFSISEKYGTKCALSFIALSSLMLVFISLPQNEALVRIFTVFTLKPLDLML